jgi:hypothetical protein
MLEDVANRSGAKERPGGASLMLSPGALAQRGTCTGTVRAEAPRADAAAAEAGKGALSATLDDLASIVAAEVRGQTRRIAELELALADAEARILSQARLICASTLAADGDLFSRRPVREIVEEVLAHYPGIRWEEIIGVGRERRLVEPRHRCMSAVYEERTDLSLPALGRIFHRDHTSVLHAVNKRDEDDKGNDADKRHRADGSDRADCSDGFSRSDAASKSGEGDQPRRARARKPARLRASADGDSVGAPAL